MGSSERRAAALVLLVLAGCAGPAPRPGAEPAIVDAACRPFDLDALAAAHDATVVVFWSTGCPCVARYQARLDALRAAYPADRVAIVAVSSNADDDPAATVAAYRERTGPDVPLLLDLAGGLAGRVGARSTPTAVVLDRAGAVRFRGWIDNERRPGEPGRIPYLRRALDGLLAGAAVESAAPVYGCAITRTLGAPRRCDPATIEAARIAPAPGTEGCRCR